MKKNTKKEGETAHAVRNDPFSTQLANAANAKNALLPRKAPRNNHTPDLAVFSRSDQPIPFRTSLPGPGDTEEKRGGRRQVTISAHPDMISHNLGNRQAGVPICVLPTFRHATFLAPAAEKQASQQQDTRPGTEYSYSSALLLSQLHRMNFMYTHPNSHVPLNYHMHCGKPNEFTRAACVPKHEFVRASCKSCSPCGQPTLRVWTWTTW